jgi:IS4 transposase
VLDLVYRKTLSRLVERFDAESRVRHFGCRQQLIIMVFAQLTWRIELFFRWIKEPLRIKHYFGTSPNAVKTKIWIAITTYLMVAIIHKQLNLPGTMH